MNNRNLIIYSVAIILILTSAIGWQTADNRTSATTTEISAPPMPNLDGEKAKQYLAQKGLDKSLGEAIQTARNSVNRVEHAPISNGSGAFEAKNPQQEFAAYFTGGVNLVSRRADEKWNLSLKLKGYGRGAEQRSAVGGRWSADKTKVSASHQVESPIANRQSQITELFENKPEGLEQSFVIQEKIEAQNPKTEDRLLKIVLNIKGDLQPVISADGQALIFTRGDDGASVLRYDKLKSWDASGVELTSKMELNGDELSLVVDDAGAVYPVTIDPTFTQVKKITADGAANDEFGNAVAIDGNTAIVGVYTNDIGANTNQGAAYIFDRNSGGANNWGQVRKLTASDGADQDWFGFSVGISGDAAIVGAILDDFGANLQQGSAYIFERNAGGTNNWGEVKKLVASDGSAGDQFSISVSVSGDTVIVGTSSDQVGANTNQGSAYIFKQNTGGANNWGQVKKIVATDGSTQDFFGKSVAISGDTAIVGALGDDVGGALNQGSAYIFVSNNNAWGQQTKISSPPPTNCGAADNYGFSVAVSGDTAVIGAPGDDVGIDTNQGSVYILERNAGGANNWGLVKLLTAADGVANDQFGYSVAISGNSVIVGADGGPSETNTAGSAYIYECNNGGTNNFGEVKKLTASDGTTGDRLGWSVAINGNTAIVGAVKHNANQGSAYIYERNQGGANNWGEIKKLIDAGGAANEFFGSAVAIKNDLVFVSSPSDSVGANISQGSVHIFERNAGGANNWARTKYLTVSDGALGDNFGWSVAISGNFLITTAPGDGIGEFTGEGAAYIFERNTGGAENWGLVKKIRAADAGQQDKFGRAVGISGDAAIVGAPYDDVGANADQGSAYIFEQNAGGANNWGQVNKLTATDGAAGDVFGYSVAVSSDNFLVGAYLANASSARAEDKQNENLFGGNTKGAGYVFKGNALLAPTAASVSIGGRVTANKRGVARAFVNMVDVSTGETRIVPTNSFGYYRFADVEAGRSYVMSVRHKQYQFTTRIVTVNEDLDEVNFTANGGQF